MAFSRGDKNINRKGRPKKGQALTDILNYELDQKEGGILYRHKIAKKLIELADGGNLQALIYIFNRLDGSPRQSIVATGGLPDIEVRFIDFEKDAREAIGAAKAKRTPIEPAGGPG